MSLEIQNPLLKEAILFKIECQTENLTIYKVANKMTR